MNETQLFRERLETLLENVNGSVRFKCANLILGDLSGNFRFEF
jgi:hypothetical protein